MGMYTEIFVEGMLKANVPEEVVSIVKSMFNDSNLPDKLPEHKFFTLPRWSAIGSCSSFYHIPFALSRTYTPHTGQLCFISRSDLKNYDGEIEEFLDWIKPYCEILRGWSWYEEATTPTVFNFEEY